VWPGTVGEWMQLKGYPRKPEVLQKLMELTGKSPWELFPEFLREPEWREDIKNLPREYALMRDVEVKALKGGRLLALRSAEEEYLAKVELERQLRRALRKLASVALQHHSRLEAVTAPEQRLQTAHRSGKENQQHGTGTPPVPFQLFKVRDGLGLFPYSCELGI